MWVGAGQKDLTEIKNFLLKKEWKSVALSSKIKENLDLYDSIHNKILINKDGDSILEVILITRTGILFTVLDDNLTIKKHDQILRNSLNHFTSIYCVMGTRSDVEKITPLLPSDKSTSVDYDLMYLTSRNFVTHNPVCKLFKSKDDFQVKIAAANDIKKILPLQEAYEKEEVYINPMQFNKKNCMLNLKSILNDQIVLYAEYNGRPIVKVQTNARGFITDQIGGVFTTPSCRNKGFAALLIGELLNKIFSEKKACALFVKKINEPARHLYLKIGFDIIDDYRIVYLDI